MSRVNAVFSMHWLKKTSLCLLVLCCLWIFSIKSIFVFPNSVTFPFYLSKIGVSISEESFMGKKKSGMSVFIINLDRDVYRYQALLLLVQQLNMPYQRVSGIVGRALPESFRESFVDEKIYKLAFNGAKPGAGEIGCFLSHVKAWTLFLNSNAEFALILEDDAQFNPSILASTLKQLVDQKKNWDICSLFIPATPLTTRCVAELRAPYTLVRFLTETTGTVGVVLNRNAALALLSKAEKYTLPVDHYIQRTWEFDRSIQFTGVSPGVITETQYFSSIDQEGRREKAPKVWGLALVQRMRSQIFHGKSKLFSWVYNEYLTLSKFFSHFTNTTQKAVHEKN